jgi:hypothetical protein
MKAEREEYWRTLCEQAMVETDQSKLIALVEEINRILEEDERQRGSPPLATFD